MSDEIMNACIDWVNQETVYLAEYLWSDAELLQKMILNYTRVYDQHKAGDGMWCTVYGETHTKHDAERVESLDPHVEWREAVNLRWASETKWRSLNGALQMFYQKGYIKWRALTKWVDNMKKTISWWSPIYTGSSKINRVKTKARADKMAVVVSSGPWHAFAINGYDDNRQDSEKNYKWAFVCKNSSDLFPTFYIPYELVHCLFSTIEVYTDEATALKLREANDAVMIQYAIDSGITNWKELDAYATRWQVAVMLWRLNFPWEKYENALELAEEAEIWNWERPDDPILRYELMIMIWRMLTEDTLDDDWNIALAVEKNITNWNNRENKATRKDVVLMIARLKKTLYS